ncbi:MAG: hypothetical protein NVS1B4_05410 [Gemmatimonadaceae bacterium]
MAIEGPLRELGIHDVFQLLDLSRKTGALSVASELRDNEGTVYFDAGRVIHASIRSNPHPLGSLLLRAGKISEADLDRARSLQRSGPAGRRLGEVLIETGAVTARELERQVRLQIEAVVFELMSWREGFFRFEERPVADAPAEAMIRISTESLLMEGARRIDEWSRIAHKVPHLGVIPRLASVAGEKPPLLDLLPNEWSVLALIDGVNDLRAIAAALGHSEFDTARIAYGLVSTGVIELQADAHGVGDIPQSDAASLVAAARAALAEGRPDDALVAARQALTADPQNGAGHLVVGRALMRMSHMTDALAALRRAVSADPLAAEAQLDLGYCAAQAGDLAGAVAAFEQFTRLVPSSPLTPVARDAAGVVRRLLTLIGEHAAV